MDKTKVSAESESREKIWKLAALTLLVVLILTLAVFASFLQAKNRSGQLIFPAGTTYLGVQATPSAEPTPIVLEGKFTAQANEEWKLWNGKVYPFSFLYPQSLPVTSFPNDPTDAVAVIWANMKPQENVLFNITKIADIEILASYRLKPRKELVSNWWKQFSGLKGVFSITEFTNSNSMNGYKAKYINLDGNTPNDDVFFTIPKHPELIVRFGNGILDPAVFDKIIDSFNWKEATQSSGPAK